MVFKKTSLMGALAGAWVSVMPLSVGAAEQYENVGPYIGGGIGYDQPDDQDFDFRGSSTNPTQPTVPVELPATSHTGRAAINEYKGDYYLNLVGGYKFQTGIRSEVEIAYRQNEADDIVVFGNPNRGVGSDVNAEPGASTAMASNADNVKLTSTSVMLNVWYDLFPDWSWHPYVGGGVGFVRTKLHKQPTNRLTEGVAGPQNTGNTLPGPPVCAAQQCEGPRKADDAALGYQLGAGVRWDFSPSFTFGLDYRYQMAQKAKYYPFREQQETHLDSEYDTQSLMLSVNYFFSLPAKPAPAPKPEPIATPAPPPVCSDGADNDGDGLSDYPSDPGCGSADDDDELDPPQCSDGKDNDGDGLTDYPEDAAGCESADDNDETDPCKDPVVGERISLKGCGTGDILVLRGVKFEFDKARLTANAESILDNVAEELESYPDIKVELSGHTDSRGSDDYNQRLSDQRAASVKRYLEGKGVASDRMTTVGYGESRPVADNETDDGREENRRVELKITAGVAAPAP